MKRALTLAIVLGGAVIAHGQPRGESETMHDAIEHYRKQCGGQLAVSVDWASFRGNLTAEYPADSADAYCADVASTLGSICSDDATVKPAVQQIHAVRCSFDRSAGRTFRFDLQQGALAVGFSWDASNLEDALLAWVQNLPSGTASGGGLNVRQSRERAKVQPELDEAAAAARHACGGPLAVTIDWPSFEAAIRSGGHETTLASICEEPLEQLAKMCKHEPEAKRTIAATLTSATCRYDASAGDRFKFALQGGALAIGYGENSATDNEELIRYLWNTLD